MSLRDRSDILDELDHNIEDLDFEPMDTEPFACVECGELLDDEELLLGAFCNECGPLHNQAIVAHSPGRVEWASRRLRHGYRR